MVLRYAHFVRLETLARRGMLIDFSGQVYARPLSDESTFHSMLCVQWLAFFVISTSNGEAAPGRYVFVVQRLGKSDKVF